MQMPNSQTIKTFWQRPEGVTGTIALIALIAGGVIGLGLILPLLITIATNAVHLAAMLTVLGVLTLPWASKKFRMNVTIGFQLLMRKITGWIVKIDPIQIMKIQVDKMKDQLERFNQCLVKLKQTMAGLKRTIETNASNIQESMEIAAEAKKKGIKNEIFLKTRKAGRLQNSNVTLGKLYTQMEMQYRVLSKMYDSCGVLIEDTEDEVKVREEEWKAKKAAFGAMQSAMSIINGNKDERAIYQEALETIAEDVTNKSGEMERMLELSESFMDGVDLQNGVIEEKGLKMLEEWEKKADSWILGGEKQELINQAKDPNQVLDLEKPIQLSNDPSRPN